MKKNSIQQLALLTAMVAIGITACKKEDTSPSPVIKLSANKDTVTFHFADSVIIEALIENNVTVQHKWTCKDSTYSVTRRIAFKAPAAGYYSIKYSAVGDGGVYSKTVVAEVLPLVRPIQPTSSKYITQVFDYLPAPGQFVNETSFGTPGNAQKLIGQPSILVTLGGFGGYVVFGFDHSITNRPGKDLAIYGNPLRPPMEWSEPGAVMVSQDVNGNGLPDDAWYELAGSEYAHATTVKNYTITYVNPKGYSDVTWTDNKGGSGAVEINNYHKHNYYPEFAPNLESITFTGTRIRNTFGLLEGTGIYINRSFAWGYTDSWSSGDDFETNRYNAFDLSWAVKADGSAINLASIDFVKVYAAQNDKGNRMLGEISCEVKGAADLNMP